MNTTDLPVLIRRFARARNLGFRHVSRMAGLYPAHLTHLANRDKLGMTTYTLRRYLLVIRQARELSKAERASVMEALAAA